MNHRTSSNTIDKVSVYIAAGLISGCGALMFNVMPAFVGAMAHSLPFDESELGDIVASFNIGFTAVALLAVFWARQVNWRIAAVLGIIGAVIGLLAISTTSSYPVILMLMGTVGLAMGALYALVMTLLGDSDNPDRAFGLKLGLETIPGAILLFVIPAWIVPVWGLSGTVYVMAAALILLGIASVFLPAHGMKVPNRPDKIDSAGRGGLGLPLLALASSLIFFTGIAATWAFLELLARARDLEQEAIGTVLAVAFVICGLGGFIAAALGDRYGRRLPLVGIVLINCAGLWSLATFSGIDGYTVGTGLFLFSVNFTLAYTFGLTAEVDIKGGLVMLSAACLSIGAIIGPSIAGRLVEIGGFEMMLVFSAGCSLVTLLVYLAVVELNDRKFNLIPFT